MLRMKKNKSKVKKKIIPAVLPIKKPFSIKNMKIMYKKSLLSIIRNSRYNGYRTGKSFKKKNFLLNFKLGFIGRPYKKYQFLLSKNYLYLSLVVRPNNVFAMLKGILFERHPKRGKSNKKQIIIQQKKSSDYGIKITQKSVKFKVLDFLKKYINGLDFLKSRKYSFIIVNITTPKAIRKSVIDLLSRTFLTLKFRYKKIILNVKHQKVFNGCRARKQIRKKRKKFKLFK